MLLDVRNDSSKHAHHAPMKAIGGGSGESRMSFRTYPSPTDTTWFFQSWRHIYPHHLASFPKPGEFLRSAILALFLLQLHIATICVPVLTRRLFRNNRLTIIHRCTQYKTPSTSQRPVQRRVRHATWSGFTRFEFEDEDSGRMGE